MSKKEVFKRYILFVIGTFFMGLGVALAKHGQLGVTPISSVANVVSERFTFLSFGTWLMLSNCLLLAGQIVLLRRNFQPIQLLQIPLSLVFGYCTDFGMWCLKAVPNNVYTFQLVLVFAGVAVLGFGISLCVTAGVLLQSGEAFVKAISDVTGKEFSTMKIAFDVSWVAISIVLSMIFFNGRLVGTREGTIIGALLVGVCVKLIKPHVQKILEPVLTK